MTIILFKLQYTNSKPQINSKLQISNKFQKSKVKFQTTLTFQLLQKIFFSIQLLLELMVQLIARYPIGLFH